MKRILPFVLGVFVFLLAGCGEPKEKTRIALLDNLLGSLVSDGLISDMEPKIPGAGYSKNYSADFIDAEIFMFAADDFADGIEFGQSGKIEKEIDHYIREYLGAAPSNRKESVAAYRGVPFRRVRAVGRHANGMMMTTVYGGAFVQVMFGYPIGYDGGQEIDEFMNALVENLKRIAENP